MGIGTPKSKIFSTCPLGVYYSVAGDGVWIGIVVEEVPHIAWGFEQTKIGDLPVGHDFASWDP